MSDPERLEARLLALERTLMQLEFNQRTLDVHLTAIENSIVFRFLRRVGRPLIDARSKVARWLMRTRLRGICLRLSPPGPDPYQLWMESEGEAGLPPLTASPLFSLLLPSSNRALSGSKQPLPRYAPRATRLGNFVFTATTHPSPG